MGGWVLEWRVRLGSGRKGEKEGREEKGKPKVERKEKCWTFWTLGVGTTL